MLLLGVTCIGNIEYENKSFIDDKKEFLGKITDVATSGYSTASDKLLRDSWRSIALRTHPTVDSVWTLSKVESKIENLHKNLISCDFNILCNIQTHMRKVFILLREVQS